MSTRAQISKTGSTTLTRLRILPLHYGKSVPSASPAQPDPVFTTILAGGAFTGPGTTTAASPASSIGVPDLYTLVSYTPAANDTPTITGGAIGLVTFDAGSVPFPINAGDVLLVANSGVTDPVAGGAVDPLTNSNMWVVGPPQLLIITGSGQSKIKVPVLNAGSTGAVPGTWLPKIHILKLK